MKTRKTHEEFCAEIKYLTNSEFEVTGQYTKKDKKVEFLHHKCGNTFTEFPSVFLEKLQCKVCGGKINLEEIYNIHDHEEFLTYVNNHADGRFTVLGQYVDMDTRVEVECLKCGYKSNNLPRKWLRTFFCSQCNGGLKKDIFDVIDLIYQEHKAKYAVLDSSIPDDDYYTLIHLACNQPVRARLSQILKDDFQCKHCADNEESSKIKSKPKSKSPSMSTKEYAKKVKDLSNNEFKLVGDYNGVDNLVTIHCNKCGKDFPITAKQFLINMKCVHCEYSITGIVKEIAAYLKEYNYKCISDYTFDDCVNTTRPLRFNLGILKKDKLQFVLEHDTIHHYIPIYGIETLKVSKHLDAIRDAYCNEHNIKLIRIPFWQEEKFRDIIKREFLYGNDSIDTNLLKHNILDIMEQHNILVAFDDIYLDRLIVHLTKIKSKPLVI